MQGACLGPAWLLPVLPGARVSGHTARRAARWLTGVRPGALSPHTVRAAAWPQLSGVPQGCRVSGIPTHCLESAHRTVGSWARGPLKGVALSTVQTSEVSLSLEEISSRKFEIRGTVQTKMGTIKDRNGLDLRETEDIKKRCKNTQKNCTKKIFTTQIITMVLSHLEPDILECEVKWALGSITTNKASGGDGIPAQLFQILKDDAVESAALNMPANLENSAMDSGLEKVSFHFNLKEG